MTQHNDNKHAMTFLSWIQLSFDHTYAAERSAAHLCDEPVVTLKPSGEAEAAVSTCFQVPQMLLSMCGI